MDKGKGVSKQEETLLTVGQPFCWQDELSHLPKP